jgi:hypothetical protein
MSAAKQRHPVPEPHIAACLIVKDSAGTIEACLDSIRIHVDEINVYDTGSTDGTVELLERLNERELVVCNRCGRGLAPIRVKKGEWRNDFSWAREQSFKMVSDEADWLLWLDDDDIIQGAAEPPPDGLPGARDRRLRLPYDYAHDEVGNCVCVLWRERLMRREARLRGWKGPVHEVLVPPDGTAEPPDGAARWCATSTTARGPLRRRQRNLSILHADAAKAREARRATSTRARSPTSAPSTWRSGSSPRRSLPAALPRAPESGWSDERMQVQHKLATCLRVIGKPRRDRGRACRRSKERDDWAENYVGLAETFADARPLGRVERWAKRRSSSGCRSRC